MGKTAFLAMVVVLGALLACAGASHEAVGPDTFAIDCRRSASNCYREAGEVCPDGFTVLDAQGQQGAFATTTSNTIGNTTVANTSVVPTYGGSMLVRCNPEQPPRATLTPVPPPRETARTPSPAPQHCIYGQDGAIIFCE